MMNRVKVIVFIRNRNKETGNIRHSQSNPEIQIRIPYRNGSNMAIMKPRDHEGHEDSGGKNDDGSNLKIDKGLKDGLNQEEFRSKFVMIG
jgi:hypothetical protein